MKKNIIILIIIIFSQIKNNYKFITIKNKIILVKNIALNKNPKNHKKTYSPRNLFAKIIGLDSAKKPKVLFIQNSSEKYFIIINLINNLAKNSNFVRFDFNGFNLLLHGC